MRVDDKNAFSDNKRKSYEEDLYYLLNKLYYFFRFSLSSLS